MSSQIRGNVATLCPTAQMPWPLQTQRATGALQMLQNWYLSYKAHRCKLEAVTLSSSREARSKRVDRRDQTQLLKRWSQREL